MKGMAAPYACGLELKQGGLGRVAVHADHVTSAMQEQVEAVAAAAGQRQDSVVLVDLEHLPQPAAAFMCGLPGSSQAMTLQMLSSC